MDPRVEKLFKLPTKQKLYIVIGMVLLEGAGFYFGIFNPRQEEYTNLKGKLLALQSEITEKRRLADNLPQLKKEYEALNQELEHALTELPNQKEIPSLLTSITSAGKAAGLDFLLFRPRNEEPKDFYAAVPVDVTVLGTFFDVAHFFVAVGNLPRIVNISNVAVAEIREAGGRNMIRVTCLATTFRFLDKKEIKNETAKK